MNRFLKALKKVGHVAKVAGKDTLKAAEIAAPIAAPFLGPLAPVVSGAVETAENLFHASGAQRGSIPLLPAEIPTGGDEVNPLEAMAITMVMGMLQATVKNPAHKAALQNQLMGVADDIYLAYGVMPPARPDTARPDAPVATAH